MGFKILAINPGSTSTKVALYDEERPSLDLTLRHTAEQIARYANIIDQLDWRREMILTALSEHLVQDLSVSDRVLSLITVQFTVHGRLPRKAGRQSS